MSISRRSILKWGGTALAVSPIVGGTLLAITGPSAVQRQRTAARAEGLPLTPQDLRPQPPVREEDNAAPLLRELTTRYNAIPKQETRTWEKALSTLLKKPTDSEAKTAFLAGLIRYAPLIALAEQAAKRPHCDFGYDFSKGATLEFPEFGIVRHFAQVFVNRACAAESADEGFADIARAAQLGNHMAETPVMISALVYSAIQSIAHQGYITLLKRFGPSEHAESTLAAFAPAPDPTFYFGGEILLGLSTLQQLREGKQQLATVDGIAVDSFSKLMRSVQGSVFAPVLLPQWEHQMLVYWREVYQQVRLAKSDFRLLPEGLNQQGKRWQNDKLHLPQNLLVLMLTPMLSGAINSINLRTEALRALRHSALALLKDPHTPLLNDPFSGEPLHSRYEGKTLILYSVGQNRTDDGGAELSQDKTQLDLVVRL